MNDGLSLKPAARAGPGHTGPKVDQILVNSCLRLTNQFARSLACSRARRLVQGRSPIQEKLNRTAIVHGAKTVI